MDFFDFCSGIGAGRRGLEQAGMHCIGYSEINRSAITSYKLLHDTQNEKNYGDITKIMPSTLPDFDLLIAGFPCQTFSVIGRRDGFNDARGQLIFYIINILQSKKTKYFILENVKGLTTHDGGHTLKTILQSLENAGYYVEHKVLSSMNYGVPQMRQRVYFVGIRKDLANLKKKFTWDFQKKAKSVKDMLVAEGNEVTGVDLQYFEKYLNNKTNQGKIQLKDILAKEYVVVDTRQSDLRLYFNRIPTLRSFRDGLYYVRDGKLRSMTGIEAMLIQGFSREYAKKVASVKDRDLLRQAGNAMTVGVVESIGKSLLQYLGNGCIPEDTNSHTAVVGVLKSTAQFDFCMTKKLYYTYAKNISFPKEEIKAVGLYQPKSAFGAERAGVFYYGIVDKLYNVKRSQISFNCNEHKKDADCIVFSILNWIKLDNPILPSGSAKVLFVTTVEKIKSANIYSDL